MKYSTSIYKLEKHLTNLAASYEYYSQIGDWERVDFVSLCIDGTNEQLEAAKAARVAKLTKQLTLVLPCFVL